MIAYQVEGTIIDETNPEEVELIERLIAYLLEQGYTLDEIGVISPYRAQADALKETLAKYGSEFERNSVGTVHTFQGGQKAVIIFSTRQCRESDPVQFINRRPNLLYTAVSRARELFILVGNVKQLQRVGGHIGTVVEHIQQYGEIRELPSKASGVSALRKQSKS